VHFFFFCFFFFGFQRMHDWVVQSGSSDRKLRRDVHTCTSATSAMLGCVGFGVGTSPRSGPYLTATLAVRGRSPSRVLSADGSPHQVLFLLVALLCKRADAGSAG
jgi:hypothetical protein